MFATLIGRRGTPRALGGFSSRSAATAVLFGVLMTTMASPARAECRDPLGDVNANGVGDVVDVQCAVLLSLWELAGAAPADVPACAGGDPVAAGDANCDGLVDVVDVTILINYVLNKPLSTTLDGDQDGCPNACDPCGDTICDGTAGENCWTCPFDCGACDGDCCASNGTPGCADGACTDCVCALDPFCCDSSWDATCSSEAAVDCDAACGCTPPGACCLPDGSCAQLAAADCTAQGGSHTPNGTCDDVNLNGMADLCEPPVPSDGCHASEAPGATNAACEACVCGADSFCCDTAWDADCADCANGGPGYLGNCSAVDCTADCNCAPLADCCGVGSGAGCADAGCEDCVCANDSFCCETQWDQYCAQAASDTCGFFCNCPPPTACCEADGTCSMKLPAVCEAGGGMSLDGADCSDANGDNVADACFDALPWACCLPDGSCSMQTASDCAAQGGVASIGADCADSDANGQADVCQTSFGGCCTANGSAGCDDFACTQCVCGLDAFCCTSQWDALCADEANQDCVVQCQCPGECCTANPTIGCRDQTCQDCVCAGDPFCCDTGWDATCTQDAGTTCIDACGCPAPTACCTPNGQCTMAVSGVCTDLLDGVPVDGADCSDANANGVADVCE